MKAITIGSAMYDIIVLAADTDIERMTMTNATASFLLLEQGRKIEAVSISNHIGGGAVNAAVAMARLGIDVRTLTKIGTDTNGDHILERLTQEGVKLDAVIRSDELPTGTAVMVSSHDRNATIFTQRGTNTLLQCDEADAGVIAGHDLVYVASLSNRSADCFPNIVAEGSKAGAFVSVNPGIRQLTSRPGAFLTCLDQVDLLAINRVEAEALVPAISTHHEPCGADDGPLDENMPYLMRIGLEFGGFSMGLKRFFGAVRALGASNVIITDGTNGSYLANEAGIYFCPILRGEVRGTAGAGDAFISTISAFLAMGHPPELALRAATINASAVVAEIDTQIGLMKLDELEQAIEDHAADVPVTVLV